MKPALMAIALAALLLLCVHALLGPETGLMYRGPLMPVAVGMLGVGLCRQARAWALAGSAGMPRR